MHKDCDIKAQERTVEIQQMPALKTPKHFAGQLMSQRGTLLRRTVPKTANHHSPATRLSNLSAARNHHQSDRSPTSGKSQAGVKSQTPTGDKPHSAADPQPAINRLLHHNNLQANPPASHASLPSGQVQPVDKLAANACCQSTRSGVRGRVHAHAQARSPNQPMDICVDSEEYGHDGSTTAGLQTRPCLTLERKRRLGHVVCRDRVRERAVDVKGAGISLPVRRR